MPSTTAALVDAVGAFLAADVAADRDFPASDRATMDGYAVRASDLESVPAELRVVGEVAAGSDAAVPVSAGGTGPTETDAHGPIELIVPHSSLNFRLFSASGGDALFDIGPTSLILIRPS